jgi:hypothetical protein
VLIVQVPSPGVEESDERADVVVRAGEDGAVTEASLALLAHGAPPLVPVAAVRGLDQRHRHTRLAVGALSALPPQQPVPHQVLQHVDSAHREDVAQAELGGYLLHRLALVRVDVEETLHRLPTALGSWRFVGRRVT